MEIRDKEEIRNSVRKTYGKIARGGDISGESKQALSCGGPIQISTEPDQNSACCGPTVSSSQGDGITACCGPVDFSVEKLSVYMGYSKEDLKSVPEGANMGLGYSRDLIREWDPNKSMKGLDYIFSACIEAFKPSVS